MALVARIILAVLCFLMFVIKRENKLAILLLSTICFSFVSIPQIPFGGGPYLISNCFFISEIPFIVRNFKTIKKSEIGNVFLIVLISISVQIATSPHYNDSAKSVLKLLVSDFTTKYLALGYALISIKNVQDMRPMIKISYYGLIVLTLFGVANYITRHAEFINALGEGMTSRSVNEMWGEKFVDLDRFRVQAMFHNPFDYGYICIVLLILHTFGYIKKLLSKQSFFISIACCLFGIATCGCRTVIVSAFLSLLMYILFSTQLKRRLQYLLYLCLFGVMSYSFMPYVREKVDSTLTAFDTKSDYGGSSLEMRSIQYATVFKYIDGYELFGRGRGYFDIDLGWSEGKWGLKDRDFYGLEGVLMSALLESGFVGVLFYLTIYMFLFYYAYKYRNVDKQISSLSLAVLVAYFSFANMTGELSSPLPTLLVFGSMLSAMSNSHKVAIYSNCY